MLGEREPGAGQQMRRHFRLRRLLGGCGDGLRAGNRQGSRFGGLGGCRSAVPSAGERRRDVGYGFGGGGKTVGVRRAGCGEDEFDQGEEAQGGDGGDDQPRQAGFGFGELPGQRQGDRAEDERDGVDAGGAVAAVAAAGFQTGGEWG